MSTVYNGNPANVTTPLTATIVGATNANPIVIQTSAAHLFGNGDTVVVAGVAGNTGANNTAAVPTWTITVVDATHFSLNNSFGSGAYTSGGFATDLSLMPQITLPSSGDPRKAVSVNPALQAIADFSQFNRNSIRSILGGYYIAHANIASGSTLAVSLVHGGTVSQTVSLQSTVAVTGATNASPIGISTFPANHGFATGDVVTIAGVGGNTAANGTWVVTVLSSAGFLLNGSTGNAAYTSGGTANATTLTHAGDLVLCGLSTSWGITSSGSTTGKVDLQANQNGGGLVSITGAESQIGWGGASGSSPASALSTQGAFVVTSAGTLSFSALFTLPTAAGSDSLTCAYPYTFWSAILRTPGS